GMILVCQARAVQRLRLNVSIDDASLLFATAWELSLLRFSASERWRMGMGLAPASDPKVYPLYGCFLHPLSVLEISGSALAISITRINRARPRLKKLCLRAAGWGGIRTLGAFQHTRFPGVHNRPLCHPSRRIEES